MASEWIECQLADACSSIDYGFTASASDVPSAARFLRITDIEDGIIEWKDVPFVEASPNIIEKYRLDHGDVVIARTGASTGRSAYIQHPPSAVFASYLVRLKTRSEYDSRYVAYYLRSSLFWDFIRAVLGDKSAQPNASASTMTKAPFCAPKNIDEQRSIAGVLGLLDDRITALRRYNQTLEAIARAIFKSWFVDFDPVRAKAEGRATGLPGRIAALFPDSFEDSELGEIPFGWAVGKFGDVADNPRRGISPGEIPEETPYIALEHMPRKCIALSEWGTADGVESGKFAFDANDILFGKLRPYFHKVGIAPISGVCSTDILVIAPRAPEWFGFVLGHASSDAFVEHTNAGSTGTKMPRTNWHDMARYPLVLPPPPIAKAFTELTRPAVSRIVASTHQNRALASLRDVLLPKLISGEIRISTAVEEVEAR
jgi:type I restriction enzyme S subunit